MRSYQRVFIPYLCNLKQNHLEIHEYRDRRREWIADILTAVPDGLTIPFVLISALKAADNTQGVLIGWGALAGVAGATLIGLGAYFTFKREARNNPGAEKQLLPNLGISREIEQLAAREQELAEDRLSSANLKPAPERALPIAFLTAAGYLAGSFVVILPFIFITNADNAFRFAALLTLLALFLTGYLKTYYTGGRPLEGAWRALLKGALSAAAAFWMVEWMK